ncbi:MAG: TIGR04086 family membrane protein [Bacillota bacterium]
MLARGHSAIQNNSLSPSITLLLLKGLLRSLLVSFAFILLITMLIYLSPLPEWIVPYLVVVGMLASIISGSMYVGRRVETKGWLRGGITGLLYIVVILVLSHFLNLGPDSGMSLLSRLFLGFSFGCVGGILGINS